MGIFSKLFGKKKAKEFDDQPMPSSKQAPKPAPETPLSKPVSTLEEVQSDIRDRNVDQVPEPKKAPESRSQVSEADAVKPKKLEYHIKKQGAEWVVIEHQAEAPLRTFNTQKEAIAYVQEENLPHVVFKADGSPKN